MKITQREKSEARWEEKKTNKQTRGVIFTRTRVLLALLSLRKSGDYW